MLSRVAASLLLVQAQLPFPDVDLRRDVTETDGFAYILGPAKPIGSGKVERLDWAQDDSALCAQIKAKDGIAVSFWSRKNEKLVKALTTARPLSVEFQASAKCVWLFNSSNDEPSPVYRYQPDSAVLATIFDPRGRPVEVTPALTGDGAIITLAAQAGQKPAAFTYSGGRLSEVETPSGANQLYARIYRSKLVLEIYGGSGEGIYELDLTTGKPVGKADAGAGEFTVGDLPYVITKVAKTEGAQIPTQWLGIRRFDKASSQSELGDRSTYTVEVKNGKHMPEPAYMTALIASDAKGVRIGPAKSALAYWDRSNLFIREIKTMPIDAFLKLYNEWEEKTLSEQAKQVGVAMQIYSADADDLLPQSTGNLDMLFPYAKDPSIFAGFQYSMNGQSLGDIKNPGGTELGRMNGRSGRAIVYADGHVVWERRNRT